MYSVTALQIISAQDEPFFNTGDIWVVWRKGGLLAQLVLPKRRLKPQIDSTGWSRLIAFAAWATIPIGLFAVSQ
jgi:hypothetical protein